MLSIQHILCDNLAKEPDTMSNQYVAASVYPDAIRAYTKDRTPSHFERNSSGTDTSWMRFPRNMEKSDTETVSMHKAPEEKQAAIGNETDISVFEEHNEHLPSEMFLGIKDHLTQDRRFDTFVRDEIDCSGKYDDTYVFQGETYDGKGIRSVIGNIEQHGIYTLAHKVYEKTGITANQEWLETTVKPLLEDQYNQDLADKTFGFMKIDPAIDALITDHDWSKLNDGPVPQEHYDRMYDDVVAAMRENATELKRRQRTAQAESMVDTTEGPSVEAEI